MVIIPFPEKSVVNMNKPAGINRDFYGNRHEVASKSLPADRPATFPKYNMLSFRQLHLFSAATAFTLRVGMPRKTHSKK
jgi:hypothetical protein